ncbi:hypothetical protein BDW22DRAFT_1409048 [Trametopsis cervina]|nr:hypothetical protein BDW22DRAFT_1409048 [Trametopsis cervina]
MKRKLKDSKVKGKTGAGQGVLVMQDGPGGRPKIPPRFHTLPATQLKHPLFQAEDRPVLSLQPFHPAAINSTSVASTLEFDSGSQSVLTAYGVPRNILHEFRILSKPCSVVRNATLTTAKWLDEAEKLPSNQNRAIITGQMGSGKSFLLLQAVEYWRKKGHVVLYIPRSLKLIDSSSSYYYDLRTRTYLQSEFSAQVLARFRDVNSTIFEELKTTEDILLSARRTVTMGSTLSDLVRAGLRQNLDAPSVLSALMKELERQSTFPVLLAVDEVQSLYSQSKYRDPRFNTISAQHLSLPRLLLEYVSGKKQFHAGAVLGALTSSNSEFKPPLELQEALGLTPDVPAGPYVRRRAEQVAYAKGLKNIALPSQMDINEAAALYELWGKDKVLNDAPSDRTFLRLYTESAGNPRDFVWKGVMGSFAA